MTDPAGHRCPECGAPRGADHTPSCGCARRASDALRAARSAEQAAAEDFDPLRIRPYVELEQDAAVHPTPTTAPAVPTTGTTMPLRAVPPGTPSSADLRLFEGADPGAGHARADGAARRPRGRRRAVLLGAGGAVVAVTAAAGLASGMFSYQKPSRDGALPDDVRASVPDASTSAASAPSPENASPARPSPPPSTTPAGSASPAPPASPSAPASASAAPSASPPPSPSGSGGRTSPAATGTPGPGPSGRQTTSAPVLALGSQGPEVTELELRLTQLGLYPRKPRGHYDRWVESAVSRYQWARGIHGDGQGVYGPQTRARLESETRQP
ncbi:peptidoglycan-binding domain-containing protein [Streptomyces sediminimaris]|uniref:peptidoglycan-binding domain-containing protein n=1 Tax=Streptomyces sediminimaris TaxID=3383721 RepID=UPI00399AE2E7